MSARIVAQIEALIARLSAAREILASTLPVAEVPRPDDRVLTMQARETFDATERQPAPAVQVTVVKPRERRQRRTVIRRASAPAAAALAGNFPQQPVAVSPRQLAQARASRAPEPASHAAVTAPRSAFEELMMEVKQRSA